jgi:hypothetical protein
MREQKGGAKVASDEVVPPAEVRLEAAHERVHTAHLAQREDRLHNTRSLLLPHLHQTSHHCVCRIRTRRGRTAAAANASAALSSLLLQS